MAGRALVLGGGGITGIAWELGMLTGLAEAGVDLCAADVVIGTSAGSVVGAQVTSGVSVQELYAAQLDAYGDATAARMGRWAMARYGWEMLRTRDPRKYRARIGRMARRTRTTSEADRRDVIGARLHAHLWPARRLLITAVDAHSGEFVAFDRESGVGLVEAVAASCAVPGVWPPISINGEYWVDGGIRSPANADLAAGYDRVVVLAPLTAGAGPIATVADQVAGLREHASVALVSPNRAALQAIGRNVLDPARRAPAARAGRAQAGAEVATVHEVWST